jgi:hypothetical protein
MSAKDVAPERVTAREGGQCELPVSFGSASHTDHA